MWANWQVTASCATCAAHLASSPPSLPLLQKPTTLAEAVDQLVALQLEEERTALAARYQQVCGVCACAWMGGGGCIGAARCARVAYEGNREQARSSSRARQ